MGFSYRFEFRQGFWQRFRFKFSRAIGIGELFSFASSSGHRMANSLYFLHTLKQSGFWERNWYAAGGSSVHVRWIHCSPLPQQLLQFSITTFTFSTFWVAFFFVFLHGLAGSSLFNKCITTIRPLLTIVSTLKRKDKLKCFIFAWL